MFGRVAHDRHRRHPDVTRGAVSADLAAHDHDQFDVPGRECRRGRVRGHDADRRGRQRGRRVALHFVRERRRRHVGHHVHVRPVARYRPRRGGRARGRPTGVGRVAERRQDRRRHGQEGSRLFSPERLALLGRSEVRARLSIELCVATSRRSAQAHPGRRRHCDLRTAHLRDASVARSREAGAEPPQRTRCGERAARAERAGAGRIARRRAGTSGAALSGERQRERPVERPRSVRERRREGAAERGLRARSRRGPSGTRSRALFELIDAQRRAQHRPRRAANALGQRARGIRRRATRDGDPREALPAGRPLGFELRLYRFRTRVDQRSDRDPRHRDRARRARDLPLPAGLAHDADPGDHDPRLADRHVRTREGARILDQHAHPLRADARDRARCGRRHRRDRKHRAIRSERQGPRPRRSRRRGDERNYGRRGRDVARATRRVRARRLLPGRHRATLQAVRAHDRLFDLHFALRRSHADAGALRHLHKTRGGAARARLCARQSRDRRNA